MTKQKNTPKMIWWILRFWARVDLFGFFGSLTALIIDPVFQVVRWYILAYIIDVALIVGDSKEQLSLMIVPSILFFLYYLISRLAISSRSYFEVRRQNYIDWNLDKQFAEKIASLSLSEVDNRNFANKIALAGDAKDTFAPRVHNAMSAIQNLIVIFIVTIPLILDGYWMVVVGMLLLMFPVMWINGAYIKKNAKLKEKEVENKRKQVQAIDIHTGIAEATKEVKINQSYSLLAKPGIEYKEYFSSIQMGYRKIWLFRRYLTSILEAIVVGGFILYYVFTEITGKGNISGVIPFFGTILMLRVTFNNFMHSFVNISEYHDEIARLRELLEHIPTSLFHNGNSQQKITGAPSVRISELTHVYPDSVEKVLQNLNIDIGSGEKVAFVGKNGAGKTTLIKLILGMYKPQQGEVLVNDIPLFSYNAKDYYNSVGILFQDFPRYGFLSVKQNLLIGRSDIVDEDKMWEVLDRAQAKQFVSKYPQKLDQILDHKFKDGVTPSTGQWQKLAVARMFYRDPNLVIFDEPTASIDADAEYKIFNEIFSFFKNKTVIIVSHRFSTVRNADRIFVIADGKVAEQGTHKELMEQEGLYASSFKKQAEGYKD